MRPLVLARVATLPAAALEDLRAPAACRLAAEVVALDEALEAERPALEEALHDAAGPPVSGDRARAAARFRLLRLRRAIHAGTVPEAAAVPPPLRAGVDAHRALLRRRERALEELRRAVDDEVLRARESLAAVCAHPIVDEGVRLASRSLHAKLRRGEPRVVLKALSYADRAATKTSPNGLFCATALARVDESAAVEGSPVIDRLDVLVSVVEARKVAAVLAADPLLRSLAPVRVNPTLRPEGDRGGFTFWRLPSLARADDDEVLTRVAAHPVLEAFLDEARAGTALPQLVEAVALRCELDPGDLARFAEDLVARGILLAEIPIPYNARRPLRVLARACRAGGVQPAWLAEVEAIEEAVDGMATMSHRARISSMDAVGRAIERLPHVRPLEHDEMFRVDARCGLRVTLREDTLEAVHEGVRAYARLFSALYPAAMYEEALARRFLAVFPADVDVPFLDMYRALDTPAGFTRPASFPQPEGEAGPLRDGAVEAGRRARELFARRARACLQGDEVALSDEDLREICGSGPEPAWTCGVLFQATRSGRAVLNGLYQGVGLALARLAWLHDDGTDRLTDGNPIVAELRRAWRALEEPGALLAEMTFNHRYRTANAGLRPSVLPHEIELPGDHASPGARVLPLHELTMRYRSAERRLVLRWTPRNVEVRPVLGSGVNPLGLVALLVAVGQAGLQPLGFFPGFDVTGVTHWPRVVRGPLVLFRERWVFEPGEWPCEPDLVSMLVATTRWRARHRLPRHVFVHGTVDPKPRHLDLESLLHLELLRARAPAERLTVTEMLPGPEDLLVPGHASEFLVQMQGPRVAGSLVASNQRARELAR